MIEKDKAEVLIKKYCPSVTLVIADRKGKEGIYLKDNNRIVITKDWTITGLLHEMTHAILYLEEGRIGHDGVFADRFTKLVAEVFEGDKDDYHKQCVFN